MIDNLLITAQVFTTCMMKTLSVVKILLFSFVNWFTNVRNLPLKFEMNPSSLKHKNCFISVHEEDNATCCLLMAMQQGCICEKRCLMNSEYNKNN